MCQPPTRTCTIMILHFDISTQRILRECISQTSLDLQAIRSRGNEASAVADTIYQDWVMNEDNMPDIYTPLEQIGATLCQRLRNKVESYASGVDIINIAFCVSSVYNGVDSVIDSYLLHYYKNSLLAWWYSYRDTTLAEQYMVSAEDALQALQTMVNSSKAKLTPHYF